jgi:hypothetical protein
MSAESRSGLLAPDVDEYRIQLALSRAARASATGEVVGSFAFTFATLPVTTILLALPAGSIVNRVCVLMTSTFDGAGAGVAVGLATSTQKYLALGDVDVTSLNTFDAPLLDALTVANSLTLFVVAGAGATKGAGVVLWKVKLP